MLPAENSTIERPTEIVPIMEGCPFCKAANRQEVEEGIRDSTFSKGIVARELGMTTQEVYDHMMNHGGSKIRAAEQPKSVEMTLSKKDLVLNTALDLYDRFSQLLQDERGELSPNTTKQLVSIADGIRKSMKDLAELEGELAKEQQITIIHYNEFKAQVFNILSNVQCPRCGQKLSEHMLNLLSANAAASDEGSEK